MTVNWTKIRKQIPSRVHVRRGVFYEVVWCEQNAMPGCIGQTRPDTKQIVIEMGHSDKETVYTYLHELAHAFSIEYEIGLTESQVLKFEKCIYYLLKENNVLKGKIPKCKID